VTVTAPYPHVIIFDVEGTLINCVPETLMSWQKTLAAHGLEYSTGELQQYSGMDAKLMLRSLLPSDSHDKIESLIEQQGQYYREACLPSIAPFPGAHKLFQVLATAGHRLGLATTCQSDELKTYLSLLDIAEFLTSIVCGEDVKIHKPAPDMVELAMGRLNASTAAGSWMVGDSPFDAAAATAAGAKAIGTLGGGFSRQQLMNAGCAAVVDDLSALLRVLTLACGPDTAPS
jgi:phosphoglycolate phosphatase-like HAD superfamily hydrolase